MSVQEIIDALNKVEDKSRGITVYLSSNNPEMDSELTSISEGSVETEIDDIDLL